MTLPNKIIEQQKKLIIAEHNLPLVCMLSTDRTTQRLMLQQLQSVAVTDQSLPRVLQVGLEFLVDIVALLLA